MRPDLEALTDTELFGAFGAVMEELRVRGLTRSSNNPAADYAELLIARYFGVEPAKGVQQGYDLLTADETRVQVKARRRTPRTKPPAYGWMQKLESREFDRLAAVLFSADFTVAAADLLTWEAVWEFAKWNERVGAHRLPLLTPKMREHPGVEVLKLKHLTGDAM